MYGLGVIWRFALFVFLCFALPLHAWAISFSSFDNPTNEKPAKRVKVAVVLSGGGAKALAHIGFLEYLESKHIKIDVIGGASMGAFVAALYASGYSVAQIKALFLAKLDWDKGEFGKQYAYNGYHFGRDNSSFFNFNVKNFKSVTNFFPNNLISAEPLALGLMGQLSAQQVFARSNFDSLFTTFRCYAVEVGSHKRYEFKSGNIVKAILASMAYPFYLPPQTKDSLTFFDGGIYDNFPVQPIKDEFKPQYIIGSETALNPEEDKGNNSFAQLIRLIKKDDEENFSKYADDSTQVAIVSHKNIVRKYSTFDFTNVGDIISRGYENTAEQLDTFFRETKTPTDTTLDTRRKKYNFSVEPLLFSKLVVQGMRPKQVRYIATITRPHKKIWTIDAFRTRFSKIFCDPRFRNFVFDYAADSSSSDYQILQIKKADFMRHSIDLGGGILGGGNGGLYNLHISYGVNYFWLHALMRTKLNLTLSNFNNQFQLSQRLDFPAPFLNSLTLYGAIYSTNYYNWQSIFNNRTSFNFLTDIGYNAGAKWEIPLSRTLNFTAFGKLQNMRLNYYNNGVIPVNTDSSDRTHIFHFSLGGQIERNTLNRKQYPFAGSLFRVRASFNRMTETYRYLSTTAPVGMNNSVIEVPRGFKDPVDLHRYYIIDAHYEKYVKVLNFFQFGIVLDGVLSNIQTHRDYYTTLAVMPHFQPIVELQYLFRDEYFAPSLASTGFKFIMNPIKKARSIALQIEGYFLYRSFFLQRTANNQITPIRAHTHPEKLKLDILKSPVLSASFIWSNKYVPVSVTANYYARDITRIVTEIFEPGRVHIYFTLGYILNYKKRTFYHE